MKGFAISVDSLLAMLLILAFLGVIGLGIQEQGPGFLPQTSLKQIADDTFIALDNSGLIAERLADAELRLDLIYNPTEPTALGIYDHAKALLPDETELKVVVREFRPKADLGGPQGCRAKYGNYLQGSGTLENVFGECFGTEYASIEYPATAVPSDREIVHGKRIAMLRQPKGDEGGNECILPAEARLKEANSDSVTALLQGLEADIETSVEVDPSDSIDCDQSAQVTLKARNASRDPIVIVLAVDESGSMETYDISQGEIASNPPQLGGGTCGGLQCESGTCSNFTNWQLIGTFDVNQEMIDTLPPGGDFRFYASSHITSGCGSVPRIKIETPAGDINYPSNEGTGGSFGLDKSTFASRLGTWKIYAWSDSPVTFYTWLRMDFGSYQTIQSGTLSGIGTANGSGSECSNYGGYENIGEFVMDDNWTYSVYGRFNYAGYTGKCDYQSVIVKDPSGDWFNPQFISCPKPNDSWCVSSRGSQEEGTYEIWAWSDEAIAFNAQYYFYKRISPLIPSQTVSGGTCGGASCAGGFVACGDYGNFQELGSFTIPAEDHLRGVHLQLDNSSYGKCNGSRMTLYQGANDFNAYYYTGCRNYRCEICLNDTGDSCINPYDGVYSENVPVSTGLWNVRAWSTKDVDFSLSWDIQRIDAAKKAAKTFIDNAQWKEGDDMGIVGFSRNANLVQSLTDVVLYGGDVKNALNTLTPSGETGVADAISAAATELSSASGSAGKFIIVLTDGQANVCAGGMLCTVWSASQDAITAAEAARGQGITVYVIGFAELSEIQGTVPGTAILYEDILKEIAKDKDSSFCPDPSPGNNCGKYYFAADGAALQEMYNLIAIDIARIIGGVDIEIPIPEGMELSNFDTCGVWDESLGSFTSTFACSEVCSGGGAVCKGGETLLFLDHGIGFSGDEWWAAQFDAVLPCNGNGCSLEYVLFPPVGTNIIDNDNENKIDWDGDDDAVIACDAGLDTKCHQKIPLKYSDLNVIFTAGEISVAGDYLVASLEIDNNGFMDVALPFDPASGLQVSFYQDNFGQRLGPSLTEPGFGVYLGDGTGTGGIVQVIDGNLHIGLPAVPGNICSLLEAPCEQPNFWKLRINDIKLDGCFGTAGSCTGTLLARINGARTINECALHNQAEIYCTAESNLRFFTIDYFVWEL